MVLQWFFVVSLLVPCLASLRIAVVGGGVGGSAVSQFLRESFGEQVSITVFEKNNRIGGRVKTVEVDGELYETGAAIAIRQNEYITGFAKLLNISTRPPSHEGTQMGIWDGNTREFVFLEVAAAPADVSWWWRPVAWLWRKVSSPLQMVYRYGLSLSSLTRMVKDTVTKFVGIYTRQQNGEAFISVEAMLRALELLDTTQQSLQHYARDRLGEKGDLLVRELGSAVNRNNYNQDITMTALPGMIGLAPLVYGSSSIYAVQGGFDGICQGLLARSRARIQLRAHVTTIRATKASSGKLAYSLELSAQSAPCSGLQLDGFDAVVIATPLEQSSLALQLGEDSVIATPESGFRNYRLVYTTIIRAQINHEYFGFESAHQVPDEILTTESPATPFTKISTFKHYRFPSVQPGSPEPQVRLMKMFSRANLTQEQFSTIFSNISFMYQDAWLAYPQYVPPERFAPFRLGHHHVYYINAIESAGSAMEMSAVGARNVALLLRDQFRLPDGDGVHGSSSQPAVLQHDL